MRTFSTCSTARSAAAGVKWMSATSGARTPRRAISARIAGSASASAVVGTVTRTISHPAATRRSICPTVPRTSEVRVVVIDWMRIGFAPPTATSPTATTRVGRRA